VSLVVIETHPVQYHAPVYRSVQQDFAVPVTAIYGSDFSVAGYTDREFGTRLAWDTDLLGGYSTVFLSKVAQGGARSDAEVKAHGLRKALAQLEPKAILLLGYSPRFHQYAFLEARRTRRPLLFRGETNDHSRPRGALKRWARDSALSWIYRRCSRLLYVGQHSTAHFRRLRCPESKLIFSPYCVDTAAFQSGEADRSRLRKPVRTELGIRDGDVALLFSGKLSPRKGPDLLIAAVKALPAVARENIVLLFLGDGELKTELAKIAQEAPALRTHFLGFKNQTELSKFYHAADLLALPSVFSETWGLVVNEALHHGVPCVVSDSVGCAPDLVLEGQTGSICQAGSVEALSAALERSLKLANRADVRLVCRQQVAGYSVRLAAEGIARAYREVVTDPGGDGSAIQ